MTIGRSSRGISHIAHLADIQTRTHLGRICLGLQ